MSCLFFFASPVALRPRSASIGTLAELTKIRGVIFYYGHSATSRVVADPLFASPACRHVRPSCAGCARHFRGGKVVSRTIRRIGGQEGGDRGGVSG